MAETRAKSAIVGDVSRFLLLALLSYGLLYFSLKFYTPVDDNDYTFYLSKMYLHPLDLHVTIAPAVFRQVTAVLVNLVYRTGITYPTYFPDDHRLIFAVIMVNYLALIGAATLAGNITARRVPGFLPPLLAGLLCILSFHVQGVVMTGMAEGVTWLMVALLYLLYENQNKFAFALLLLLSMWQREMIAVTFTVLAAVAFITRKDQRQYNLFVLASAVTTFLVYFVMRKYLLAIPGHTNEMSASYLLGLRALRQLWRAHLVVAVIFQGFLSQNILFLAVGTGLAERRKTGIFPRETMLLLIVFGIVAVITLLAGGGTGVGRIAGMLTPVFAAITAAQLFKLERAVPA